MKIGICLSVAVVDFSGVGYVTFKGDANWRVVLNPNAFDTIALVSAHAN